MKKLCYINLRSSGCALGYLGFTITVNPNMPRVLREMSGWLAKNHYDTVF
jgi:hypothetical protein